MKRVYSWGKPEWSFPRRNREQERLEKAEINSRRKRNCSYGRNRRLVRTRNNKTRRTSVSEDVDHSWRSRAKKRAQALGNGQIQRLFPSAAPTRTWRHRGKNHRWVLASHSHEAWIRSEVNLLDLKSILVFSFVSASFLHNKHSEELLWLSDHQLKVSDRKQGYKHPLSSQNNRDLFIFAVFSSLLWLEPTCVLSYWSLWFILTCYEVQNYLFYEAQRSACTFTLMLL